jgi:hypothetical protein
MARFIVKLHEAAKISEVYETSEPDTKVEGRG